MSNTSNVKLSRRQVLAGLGTIGVASAGAGLGTTAFFTDTEELEGWYESGRVDLILDYRSTYKPWERYDLQMVPAEDRPAIVAGTNGMTYEIAAAPAVRFPNGEAVDHETWGFLQTDEIDACRLVVPTDLTSEMNTGLDLGDLVVEDAPERGYRPGYIDGQSGEGRAMFIDLDDIKPYDEGETTFSFHLCGNPSFVYAEVIDAVDEEVSFIEPERSAGDDTAEDGELCEYLYVIVSTDPDCDNLNEDGTLGDIDGDGTVDNDDDGSEVLYAGSLKGWIEIIQNSTDGQLRLPPVTPANADVSADCFAPGVHCYVMEWYLPCKENDEERLGFTDLPLVNNPVASGTFNDELRARGFVGEDDEGNEFTFDVNVAQTDSCHVGLRFTAEQCRHNTTTFEDEGDPDDDGGNGRLDGHAISWIAFCSNDDLEPEDITLEAIKYNGDGEVTGFEWTLEDDSKDIESVAIKYAQTVRRFTCDDGDAGNECLAMGEALINGAGEEQFTPEWNSCPCADGVAGGIKFDLGNQSFDNWDGSWTELNCTDQS
ncbi:hypothetical protein [Haloarchaeobius sp. DT45]|uniref:hypothetical protein n=1 Tax=Haloarchaeobius sp. DT45 TaxID=3446116 RepID=UPI003F6C8AAE